VAVGLRRTTWIHKQPQAPSPLQLSGPPAAALVASAGATRSNVLRTAFVQLHCRSPCDSLTAHQRQVLRLVAIAVIKKPHSYGSAHGACCKGRHEPIHTGSIADATATMNASRWKRMARAGHIPNRPLMAFLLTICKAWTVPMGDAACPAAPTCVTSWYICFHWTAGSAPMHRSWQTQNKQQW
jgi:hypothetical protein